MSTITKSIEDFKNYLEGKPNGVEEHVLSSKNEPSLTIATDISESIEAKRQAENGEYEVIGDANDVDKYDKNVIDESSKG